MVGFVHLPDGAYTGDAVGTPLIIGGLIVTLVACAVAVAVAPTAADAATNFDVYEPLDTAAVNVVDRDEYSAVGLDAYEA